MSEENKKQNPEVNETTLENVDGGVMPQGVRVRSVQIPQPIDQDDELARTGETVRLWRTNDPDRLQRSADPDRLQRANDPDKRFV